MSEISHISPPATPVLRNPPLKMENNVVAGKNQIAAKNTTATATATATATNSLSKTPETDKPLTTEVLHAAVKAGNNILQASNKNLQFQVDDATKQVVVSIVDSNTGEVIRQIPTVEMLDFMRAMALQETNTGKLLQAKA
jgi:flagellar protein FlaG